MQKLIALESKLRHLAETGSPRCRAYSFFSTRTRKPAAAIKAFAAMDRHAKARFLEIQSDSSAQGEQTGMRMFHGTTNKQLRSDRRTVYERPIADLNLPAELLKSIQDDILNGCDHLSDVHHLLRTLLGTTPAKFEKLGEGAEDLVVGRIEALV